MFTGIIESLGEVQSIRQEGSNVHFSIASSISPELKIDQSVSHNGVCLTVVGIEGNVHVVTAVEETLKRSNLGQWQLGSLVNLERAMLSNGRLDGHIVQGHVDGTGRCIQVEDRDGSWNFHFQYTPSEEHLLVDKGSVCINGVSLTVVSPIEDEFSVAIIPYTYAHTTFQSIREGDLVNLEFDVIGKYIARYAQLYFKGKPT
ncbi:MAG TPA: riboflavin synthase [Haliscomenobacter sp.]|uniref:riboflavin synthase n=1 Tax=Haliscomenobacter sp. TaxID=2717303 RepID=UPI002CB1EE33|nr:riboflavin synthase [Haliscomenobacter sp.]HOY21306.1 riboflavin synthase [Haliscomenobacter sp.]